ncbi:hypothetical protein ACJX0J_030722, partial [Zea mays]
IPLGTMALVENIAGSVAGTLPEAVLLFGNKYAFEFITTKIPSGTCSDQCVFKQTISTQLSLQACFKSVVEDGQIHDISFFFLVLDSSREENKIAVILDIGIACA